MSRCLENILQLFYWFKSIILLLSKIKIASFFNLAIPSIVVGFLILASQSYYILGQLELFLIMLLLKSINSAFFLSQYLYSHYCYKTKVWTDFGRVRVRTDIGQ